ncbi:hypothetical protein B0T17DRAFT_595066 [Bombardia bombarda]|uniref:Uncharacterized protein n=1 Tax=Bombardia bombarda TaxID=252184 RepID=A0AA39XJW4_9PEZI|nr:hypothetical protein B0T17DRAFT_595066 [Bombardia bombarda]
MATMCVVDAAVGQGARALFLELELALVELGMVENAGVSSGLPCRRRSAPMASASSIPVDLLFCLCPGRPGQDHAGTPIPFGSESTASQPVLATSGPTVGVRPFQQPQHRLDTLLLSNVSLIHKRNVNGEYQERIGSIFFDHRAAIRQSLARGTGRERCLLTNHPLGCGRRGQPALGRASSQWRVVKRQAGEPPSHLSHFWWSMRHEAGMEHGSKETYSEEAKTIFANVAEARQGPGLFDLGGHKKSSAGWSTHADTHADAVEGGGCLGNLSLCLLTLSCRNLTFGIRVRREGPSSPSKPAKIADRRWGEEPTRPQRPWLPLSIAPETPKIGGLACPHNFAKDE